MIFDNELQTAPEIERVDPNLASLSPRCRNAAKLSYPLVHLLAGLKLGM